MQYLFNVYKIVCVLGLSFNKKKLFEQMKWSENYIL